MPKEVIANRRINPDKLDNEWISGSGDKLSLKDMTTGYLSHFELHLKEIEGLINL